MKGLVILMLCFSLLLCGCAPTDDAIYESAEGVFNTQVDEKQILLERTPANNETVTLINDELVKFWTDTRLEKAWRWQSKEPWIWQRPCR